MPWILSTFDLCTYYLFFGLFCCYFELKYFFLEVLMQQVCQIIKQQLKKKAFWMHVDSMPKWFGRTNIQFCAEDLNHLTE